MPPLCAAAAAADDTGCLLLLLLPLQRRMRIELRVIGSMDGCGCWLLVFRVPLVVLFVVVDFLVAQSSLSAHLSEHVHPARASSGRVVFI